MMAYYEQEDAQSPGASLVELAKVIAISSDELHGAAPLKETASAHQARRRRRL